MATAITELVRGRWADSRRPSDVWGDFEVVQVEGDDIFFREIGGTSTLGRAKNGTTDSFTARDRVTIRFPGGDRGLGRVMGRVPGRRTSSRKVPV